MAVHHVIRRDKNMNPMPELESIFAEAVELHDPAQQRAFIDRACQHDVQLKNRVGALIQANRRSATFMSQPVGLIDLDLTDEAPASVGEQPGDVIGRYHLEERMGEGGMGTVYRAQQREPVQRQVALKVIKAGLDTREVISRFESERQALAWMDHPHIARAYDAGATPSGRPYFVMEFVDGTSIRDYCNQHQLTTQQRLRLFLSVCDAIQHAHQKGIIHRDIKPQNILVAEVAGVPQPKIIDFGIAKATKQSLCDDPVQTQHGQFIGTPAYMSPEQADVGSVDVDTRSDVYSLGATLYELLTGVAPFNEDELRKKSSAEVYRVIREEVPVQPSAAISTSKQTPSTEVATARKATLQTLKSTLAGDLDWIVMRALDKDRERRYESAAALADDLRRYLNQEPVVARPPTYSYQLRKFLARNRVAVLTTMAILAVLTLATIVSTFFAVWALQSLEQAETQTQLARDENTTLKSYQQFLHDEVFSQASPFEEPDRNVTLRFTLDRAAQRLGLQDQLRPDVEAAVRTTLGQTYRGLGEYDLSFTHLRRAHDLYTDLLQREAKDFQRPTQEQAAKASLELATTLLALARYPEAKTHLDQSLKTAETWKDPELRMQTVQLLATYFEAINERSQAETLLKEVLQYRQRSLGKEHFRTHQATADLAFVMQAMGNHDEALALLTPAYARLFSLDPLHPATMKAGLHLARLSLLKGNVEQAQSLYEQIAHDLTQLLGEHHPQTLTAKHGLALVLAALQERTAAHPLLEEVLQHQRERLGNSHPSTLSTMHNLARLRAQIGDPTGAQALFEEAVESHRTAHGLHDEGTRQAISSLAFFFLDQAKFAQAIPQYQALRDSFPKTQLVDRRRLTAQAMLGLCHLKSGDAASARQVLESAMTECKQSFSDDWLLPVLEGLLGESLSQIGEREAAEVALVHSYEQLKIQEVDLPPNWRPLGLRAATRRLAEFYDASTSSQQRARAADYRAEYEHIGKFGSKPEQEESLGKNGNGDTNN